MESITVGEAVRATGGALIAGGERTALTSLSTDTRTLRRGDLFIALTGKKFDGNDFLPEAVERGCSCLVFSRAIGKEKERAWRDAGVALIRTGDTLRALQGLAAWYRGRFPIPVVAVTGSNGKTTTKEMIRAAAGARFTVRANEGTVNNQFGVPLTLLAIERRDSLAVVEIGMNARGEIRCLAEIADPGIGVITNVGHAHLEFLGSLDGVAAAKEELLDVMGERGGGAGRAAILNADDPRVAAMAERHPLRATTFGFGPDADVRAEEVRETAGGLSVTFDFRRAGRRAAALIPARGRHNVYNALAAAATCEELGVPPEETARALASVEMPAMRMEIVFAGGITLVNDAYNANPESMRAAIEALRGMAAEGRKILVMGDMLEIGETAVAAHAEAGRLAAASGIDRLVTVGELAAHAAAAARGAGMEPGAVSGCADADEAALVLRNEGRPGDVILLKGSRRTGLESIIAKMEG